MDRRLLGKADVPQLRDVLWRHRASRRSPGRKRRSSATSPDSASRSSRSRGRRSRPGSGSAAIGLATSRRAINCGVCSSARAGTISPRSSSKRRWARPTSSRRSCSRRSSRRSTRRSAGPGAPPAVVQDREPRARGRAAVQTAVEEALRRPRSSTSPRRSSPTRSAASAPDKPSAARSFRSSASFVSKSNDHAAAGEARRRADALGRKRSSGSRPRRRVRLPQAATATGQRAPRSARAASTTPSASRRSTRRPPKLLVKAEDVSGTAIGGLEQTTEL